MKKRAFLYSGVTFLLMVSIMLSMSYLFLQKHSKEQTKIADLELDLAQQVAVDIRDVLAVDPNNTFADAMADVAFQAINQSPSGSEVVQICRDLDPTNPTAKFNITKWILNYTNFTLVAIQNYAPPLNIKSVISNPTIVQSDCTGNQKDEYGNKIVHIWQKSNISYEITLNESSFYMRLNQTIAHNKTLSIVGVNPDPNKLYRVVIKDQTGRVDFNKTITCGLGGGLNCLPD